MEITRASPFGSNVQPHGRNQADALRKPPVFKRDSQVHPPSSQAAQARSTRASATPAVAKDGSFAHHVGDAYLGCEALGMKPGERREIIVSGKTMILRRTESDDAYVLQTPDDADNAPFNGLHIGRDSVAKLNMQTVDPQHPQYLEGIRQVVALKAAVNADNSDWHGFLIGP